MAAGLNVFMLSSKLFSFLSKIPGGPLLLGVTLGFSIFCFSGGCGLVDGLLNGFSGVRQAAIGATAVFFGGFLMTGFFGLMFALKNRDNAVKCLLGLGVVLFSYFSIESLYGAVV
jgi:hypothetical protein